MEAHERKKRRTKGLEGRKQGVHEHEREMASGQGTSLLHTPIFVARTPLKKKNSFSFLQNQCDQRSRWLPKELLQTHHRNPSLCASFLTTSVRTRRLYLHEGSIEEWGHEGAASSRRKVVSTSSTLILFLCLWCCSMIQSSQQHNLPFIPSMVDSTICFATRWYTSSVLEPEPKTWSFCLKEEEEEEGWEKRKHKKGTWDEWTVIFI